MAIVISIVNNKGGVGKTTTVANLGYAWARSGKKVLLVDLDSQANLTTMVSSVPIEEHQILIEKALEDDLYPPIDAVEPNLDVVPSGLSLANFERKTAGPTQAFLVQRMLEKVKNSYDYILLDCPPALSLITYNALIASDFFILIGSPDSMSYSGMKMIITLAGDVKNDPRMNPNLKFLGCILTMANPRQKVDNLFIRRVKQDMGERYFVNVIINREAAVQQAAACGQSIFDYKDDNGRSVKAAPAYQEIAEILNNRIHDRLEEEAANK